MPDFRVAIIGASIAGSALAMALGKHGIKTALIDKARFPRAKPCGEGLSVAAVNCMARLGFETDSLKKHSKPLKGYELINHSDKIKIISPEAVVFGIERLSLDSRLFSQAAMQRDIQVIENADVCSFSNDGFSLKGKTITADFIVFACGVNSPLLKGLKRSYSGPRRFGIRTLWHASSGFDLGRVTIYVHDGYEIFLTPLKSGRLNATLLCRRGVPGINKESCVNMIKEIFEKLEISAQLVSAPLGYPDVGNSRSAETQILAVGDAAESFDAAGGMGMTHAVLSSEILAKKLKQYYNFGLQKGALVCEYRKERELVARPLRAFTRGVCALTFGENPLAFKLSRQTERAGSAFINALISNRPLNSSLAGRTLQMMGRFL